MRYAHATMVADVDSFGADPILNAFLGATSNAPPGVYVVVVAEEKALAESMARQIGAFSLELVRFVDGASNVPA